MTIFVVYLASFLRLGNTILAAEQRRLFLIGFSNQLALVGGFLLTISLPKLVHGFFERVLDLRVARWFLVLEVDDSVALLHNLELFFEPPLDGV